MFTSTIIDDKFYPVYSLYLLRSTGIKTLNGEWVQEQIHELGLQEGKDYDRQDYLDIYSGRMSPGFGLDGRAAYAIADRVPDAEGRRRALAFLPSEPS